LDIGDGKISIDISTGFDLHFPLVFAQNAIPNDKLTLLQNVGHCTFLRKTAHWSFINLHNASLITMPYSVECRHTTLIDPIATDWSAL